MKTFLNLKRIALFGAAAFCLNTNNVLAYGDDASLGHLLGHQYIDLISDLSDNSVTPIIVNTVVNIGEVDASVTIKGERVEYNGSHPGDDTHVRYDLGTGALGNDLGQGVSWANSIETSATGAYANVTVIGRNGGCSNNDFFTSGAIVNTSFNTADIDASVEIKGWEKVDISNLHMSTQAIGAYGSVTLASGYQHH